MGEQEMKIRGVRALIVYNGTPRARCVCAWWCLYHNHQCFYFFSQQDVFVGISVTFVILVMVLPFIDQVDYSLLTSLPALSLMFIVTFVALAYHPCEEQWNDLRADTTIILAVVNGIFMSSWIFNQCGLVEDVVAPIPHEVIWPGFQAVGLMFLREAVGIFVIGVMHEVSRRLMLVVLSVILRRKIDRKGPKEIVVEFPYKYVTYFVAGSSIFLPFLIFDLLGI